MTLLYIHVTTGEQMVHIIVFIPYIISNEFIMHHGLD